MDQTTPAKPHAPEHSIYSLSSKEPLDTLEMHVLARAYRAAWRSIHARDPANCHAIESLDVMIVFGNRPHPAPTPTRHRTDMANAARNLYQIKIIRQKYSATGSYWEDLMTTEATETRSGISEIAARLHTVYPKPEHQVLVHLFDRTGRMTQVDWETPEA